MNRFFSLSVIPLAATATVASVMMASAPAKALVLGTVSINGTSSLSYSGSNVLIDFKDIDGVATTGDFSNFVGSLTDVIGTNDTLASFAISDLTLTLGGTSPFNYTNSGLTSFLNFGSRTLGNTTAGLTFDLGAGDYLVIGDQPNIISSNLLPGVWKFNGDTIAKGSVTATQFGETSSYTISVESVPEPLTILGTGIALGFGGLFKSKSSKKQSVKA